MGSARVITLRYLVSVWACPCRGTPVPPASASSSEIPVNVRNLPMTPTGGGGGGCGNLERVERVNPCGCSITSAVCAGEAKAAAKRSGSKPATPMLSNAGRAAEAGSMVMGTEAGGLPFDLACAYWRAGAAASTCGKFVTGGGGLGPPIPSSMSAVVVAGKTIGPSFDG